MNKTSAVKFLAAHQPMPRDEDVSKDLLDGYRLTLEFFLHNPAPECIPLFLNSFGERDLFGNYIRVADVLRKCSPEDVVSGIKNALSNPLRSIKYWNAQMAVDFPDKNLIKPLAALLDTNDVDVRSAAVLALSQIEHEEVIAILRYALQREAESDIRALIYEGIENLQERVA